MDLLRFLIIEKNVNKNNRKLQNDLNKKKKIKKLTNIYQE